MGHRPPAARFTLCSLPQISLACKSRPLHLHIRGPPTHHLPQGLPPGSTALSSLTRATPRAPRLAPAAALGPWPRSWAGRLLATAARSRLSSRPSMASFPPASQHSPPRVAHHHLVCDPDTPASSLGGAHVLCSCSSLCQKGCSPNIQELTPYPTSWQGLPVTLAPGPMQVVSQVPV